MPLDKQLIKATVSESPELTHGFRLSNLKAALNKGVEDGTLIKHKNSYKLSAQGKKEHEAEGESAITGDDSTSVRAYLTTGRVGHSSCCHHAVEHRKPKQTTKKTAKAASKTTKKGAASSAKKGKARENGAHQNNVKACLVTA